MPKKIDNRIAQHVPHTHPASAPPYSDAELRNHLVKYHGWDLGMVRQKGWNEEGSYIRSFHRGAHRTAHLDPPPKEA